jgi:hypothetical protein
VFYPLIKPEQQAKIGGFFMQKKKNQNGVPLSKEKFVDIIERLREASELVDKVEELFRNSRGNIDCDFCNGAALQISHEGVVVDLLQKLMRDEEVENISYFIYELEYGKQFELGMVMDGDTPIDMGAPGKLYDYLVAEYWNGNSHDEN